MATLFVRHEVENYDAWKKAYDGFDRERKTMGVTGQGVYQLDGNPNDVTVYHRFKNMDEARNFAHSDRLKEIMKGAGVVGNPEMWFTNEK